MTVEFSSVDFSFPGRSQPLQILRSVSFSIPAGSVAAVVGPSGSGKSTLLRIAAGLLSPSRGTASMSGKATSQCRKEGAIGVVFQTPALLPWRTVAANVRLALEVRHSGVDERLVEAGLTAVGLAEWAMRRPSELSGGMQQRAALARALVAAPALLLLDEPFCQLDELLRFELLFYVQDHVARHASTVLLVTHDLTEAVLASDTIHVLSSRPARLLASLPVHIPRPRSLQSADLPEFRDAIARVRAALRQVRSAS